MPNRPWAAWDALARCVGEVLVPTYELTHGDLLDCWPRHPRIVAELTWLRHAHLDAHTRGAVPAKAADWHLRHLPGVLAAASVEHWRGAWREVQDAVVGARRPAPEG